MDVKPSSFSKGDGYCFIDEAKLWNEIYFLSNAEIKNEFYEIWDTFKMDSQVSAERAEKEANETSEITAAANTKRRKRRKRAVENQAFRFLNERTKRVESVWKKFIKDGKVHDERKSAENNKLARELAKSVETFGRSFKPSKVNCDQMEAIEIVNGGIYETNDEKVVWFTNGSNECVKILMDSEEFIVPEKAEFVPGPIKSIKHLDYANCKYDLIVMDPPWPNKSVKRLRSYETFQIDDLYDLPIESLCHSNTFVIIWLTNNSTVHSSIDEILESWDLKRYKTFHWLKITQNGEPVTPFDSNHKLPYESFIIALPSNHEVFSNRKEENISSSFGTLEDNYCFISVPNSCHSRKPPLAPILEKLLSNTKFEKSLELYARYLLPKTTSIGFEVLKFQHLKSNFNFVNDKNKE